jgi:light-regulated signal transduction histidine kinase (bacteriophytochrome)
MARRIGMDPTYHERVFEVFQRLKEVEAEGTGRPSSPAA